MHHIVLSGSRTETAVFAEQKQLNPVKHVVGKSSLQAVRGRPEAFHVLPSFHGRANRFSLNSEIARIRRQNPDIPWFEYDLTPTGVYLALFEGEVVESVPAETPEPKISEIAVEQPPVVDNGPDAVPGQTGIDEHIAEAESSKKPSDDDDFLSFLDD